MILTGKSSGDRDELLRTKRDDFIAELVMELHFSHWKIPLAGIDDHSSSTSMENSAHVKCSMDIRKDIIQ